MKTSYCVKKTNTKIRSIENILFQDDAVATYVRADEAGEQAFLFEGPSGCGKTSLARVHAFRHANHDDLSDTVQFNCAQFGGRVDNVREEIINLIYTQPMRDDLSVIILDEAQMMTAQAQDVLLNAMEDLPTTTHVVICTTDVESLSKPLRSRCVHVHFREFGRADAVRLYREGILTDNPERIKEAYAACGGNYRQFLKKLRYGGNEAIDGDELRRRAAIATYDLVCHWSWDGQRKVSELAKGARIESVKDFQVEMIDLAVQVLFLSSDEKCISDMPEDARTLHERLRKEFGEAMDGVARAMVGGLSRMRTILSPSFAGWHEAFTAILSVEFTGLYADIAGAS